jgi:DNA-binding transcriptional LysR family regulator
MNIEQLQAFVAVADQASYTKASYFLHISQPSLSKQILKLEKELQVSLFERSTRKLILTRQGELFYPYACTILKAYQDGLSQIAESRQSQKEIIRLMSLPLCGEQMQKTLDSFQEQFPSFSLQIRELEERDLLENLHRDFDGYILRDEFIPFQDYEHIPIFYEKLIAILPEDAPFDQALNKADLDGKNFLFFPSYTQVAMAAENFFKEVQIDYHIVRYGRMHTLLRLCRQKEGIIIAPENVAQDYLLSNLKVLPIENSPLTTIYLYIHPHASNKRSLQALKAHIQNQGRA